MQSEIQSFLYSKSGGELMTLFGYTTSGVAGLEILGLGQRGRILKEKIIYLSRARKLKIPAKRFVLSTESSDLNHIILNNIEFPFLLLFWHLAGIINISSLDDCICSGEIKVNGDIVQPMIGGEDLKLLKNKKIRLDSYKMISEDGNGYLWQISPSLLLENISDLNFKTLYMDSPSAIPMNSSIA